MASNKTTSRVIIPLDLSYLIPVTAYITQLAQLVGFIPQEADRICLALEESLNNIIRFGYEDDTEDFIEIICEPGATGLTIRILEKGMPYSEERLPDYQPDHPELDKTGAGLGLHLIKSFSDDFKLIRKGRQGQEIHLGYRLKRNIPDNASFPQPNSSLEQTATLPADTESPQEYIIRELKQDETVEVSKCAYKCYGYTYEDYIYHPNQLAEMNQHGLLYSLVP